MKNFFYIGSIHKERWRHVFSLYNGYILVKKISSLMFCNLSEVGFFVEPSQTFLFDSS